MNHSKMVWSYETGSVWISVKTTKILINFHLTVYNENRSISETNINIYNETQKLFKYLTLHCMIFIIS
jgi:hypothetical protein